MAGQWSAWPTMVARLYIGLALASLILAGVWKFLSIPPLAAPQAFPAHFYHHVVSRFDGSNCPSFPVCSLYAEQAMARHGWLLGSWFMLDRLIHEVGDIKSGSWVMVNGEQRLYDPLSRNDFWLFQGERK